MSELDTYRNVLNEKIMVHRDEAPNVIKADWTNAQMWIDNWWKAYKAWERQDAFNTAVKDDRMTMRSFGSNFDGQVNKEIAKITIATPSRFYSNTQYGGLSPQDRQKHDDEFKKLTFKAKRGIDAKAFMEPQNFQTRAAKYELGLHDLSVKLLVKDSDIKAQSHHAAQPAPHFCFVPLSKGEDQEVIFKLGLYAKVLRNVLPAFYDLIHRYRTKMSRVKVANDYDMGTGYHAIPVANPGTDPAYKLRYGLGNTIKVRGGGLIPRTLQIYRDRQRDYFYHRANIARLGNEIVVAFRRHAGPFPIYAVWEKDYLQCFTIDENSKMVTTTGKTISHKGVANW